jgi:hypothetical protein
MHAVQISVAEKKSTFGVLEEILYGTTFSNWCAVFMRTVDRIDKLSVPLTIHLYVCLDTPPAHKEGTSKAYLWW